MFKIIILSYDMHVTSVCLLLLTGDCVMSQWSEWSLCACKENSTVSATRVRSRYIMTEPLPSAEQCKELEETEECPCYTYHKELLNWTNCEMENDGLCGSGR